ncbi:hypothetical protein GCM10010399_71510 [Dactylosporangium fulvum]|uniref:S8 family serine peptidase n=1 Tax=Dactylosporangium fulvum TaxID=53359 RepID=A0ABY5VYG1_9ACTN|nr:S8 family serine peptidase [Dactylosporangium fulvum]UWP82176.1 S8 family serine peptidase [Dactylosporangium fulvum]
MIRQWTVVVAVVAASVPVLATPAAANPCGSYAPPSAAPRITAEDWAQRWLGLRRVHALQTGAGVRVAVVDTGVDPGHPQLASAVSPGWDVTAGKAGGTIDCNDQGHGTAISSLVAARPASGIGLVGVAPAATIVPVRVADNGPSAQQPQPLDRLAAAVSAAVKLQADVIHFSYAVTTDSPALRGAVADAVKHNIVLVAAAGDGVTGPTFPAAYEGVIGVGALASTGVVAQTSAAGSHVDLVAPGENLVAAARVGGHTTVSTTAAAAALVSGAAALLRAAHPGWSAAQVAQRLFATADGTVGGPHNAAYGYGSVNPYRALSEDTAGAGVVPTWTPAPADLRQAPAQPGWPSPWRRSMVWAAILLLAATLLAIGSAVTPAFRQRHRDRAV